jgi:hypothetical protein
MLPPQRFDALQHKMVWAARRHKETGGHSRTPIGSERKPWTTRRSFPRHPSAGTSRSRNYQDRNNQEGSIAMRLYDFGALILLAGIAAMVALVVASQVG